MKKTIYNPDSETRQAFRMLARHAKGLAHAAEKLGRLGESTQSGSDPAGKGTPPAGKGMKRSETETDPLD